MVLCILILLILAPFGLLALAIRAACEAHTLSREVRQFSEKMMRDRIAHRDADATVGVTLRTFMARQS
jgi:hypothetical protein